VNAEVPKNVAASVRHRLFNRAREESQEFQLVLTRYALERLIFRLSLSSYAEKFVLKGAMLFYVWNPTAGAYRPTRDLDFLMYGENSVEILETIFRKIVQTEVSPDGLVFDPESIKAAPIREDNRYGGLRVNLMALLEKARIPLQIDIGFGDKITPGPEQINFPSLLGQDVARLAAYPKETVIAEKLEAMVSLGEANSRMKDFYDIHFLSLHYAFDGDILRQAIAATFTGRGTAIPDGEIYPLSAGFSRDPVRQRLWTGFFKRLGLKDVETSFEIVIQQIAAFVQPLIQATSQNTNFSRHWSPSGSWQK
jgi:predicted nucleotidyltransferase component of viral defense system